MYYILILIILFLFIKIFIYKIFLNNYNMIFKNIWIGNYKSSLDENFLKSNNIKLIINCTKNLDFCNLNIKKIRIPVNDDLRFESNMILLDYFYKIYDIIDNELNNNNNILVHCYAGAQRSATIVALYLMKKYNFNFNTAKHIIKNKRKICFFPFTNFKQSINYYQKNKYN